MRPARSRGKKASKTSSIFRFPGSFFLDWPIVRPLISRRHELMKMFQDKIEKVRKKNEKKQKIIKKTNLKDRNGEQIDGKNSAPSIIGV